MVKSIERKNHRIIDFQKLKAAKTHAENLEQTIISEKKLSKHDPLHAVYIYVWKNKHYWNEYIIDGFVNYQSDMIMIAGFPDVPLRMPHSRESLKARGEL